MRRLLTKLVFMCFSDFYRFMAALLDWRSHLRVLKGKPGFDVACITNFENEVQRYFMGMFSLKKSWVNGLRFSMDNTLVRYIMVNSTSAGLMEPSGKAEGKIQVRRAIASVIDKGAKVILFAAYIKRLFSEDELREIRAAYPNVAFTIGDNGTAWALIVDVFRAIEANNLNRFSRIMILGPNGFLGSTVVSVLKNSGFYNLVLLSSRSGKTNPFSGIKDIELVIACTHHSNLELTADIVRDISHDNGIYVVDVCRPVNFHYKEFKKCNNQKVKRQDAGVVFNKRLKYVFLPGAVFVLRKIGLSRRRLYGCFSEATAIGSLESETLRKYDFMDTNRKVLKFVETIFTEKGFKVSPPRNYGKDIGKQEKGREAVPEYAYPCVVKNTCEEDNIRVEEKNREPVPGYADARSEKNFGLSL